MAPMWISPLVLGLWFAPARGSYILEKVNTAKSCQQWMKSYTSDELGFVVHMNCGKVDLAIKEWDALSDHNTEVQVDDWTARGNKGKELCQQAMDQLKAGRSRDAAELAVMAFGSGIMNNHLCCTRLTPPHCVIPLHTDSPLAFRTPAGVLLCLFVVVIALMCVATCIESCIKRQQAEKRGEDDAEEELPREIGSSDGRLPAFDANLPGLLQNAWLKESCLRAVPGSHRMANSTASVFAALHGTFEFQLDSVKNQYEHFMSMILSHIAMVADRSVEGGQVDETYILVEALDDLHCELLEGFVGWREKYRNCEGTSMVAVDIPPAGGINWEQIPPALCPDQSREEATERSRQLLEIAVYLCVWGEAGNVRFMPELVYFITELALASEGPGGHGFYGGAASAAGTRPQSGRFLARIIRPLYNLVFNEWYEKVDIKPNGGDSKVLHKGFERYLLPDVANYDDWNEFFCDPLDVVNGLLLTSGRNLFDMPHEQRFSLLRDVHWTASLKGSQIKTHRECHSMWGVFAATHRIWLVHALVFFFGVCCAVGNPAPGLATDWLERPLMGTTEGVRFAAVGLLVPAHATLWVGSRLETSSNHILQKNCGFCFCLSSCFWGAVWITPLFTYAAVRFFADALIPEDGETEKTSGLLSAALAIHYSVCCFGIIFLLFFPAKRSDVLFPLTRVPLSLRAVRYLFWTVIFSIKFLMGIIVFSSVYNATIQLQFVNVGRETPMEILGVWRSSHWGASFYQWILLWITAFYMFVADTAMWYQLGCMVMGVIIVFVQRGCHVFRFCLRDDITQLPYRFSRTVFPYSAIIKGDGCSAYLPDVWDRIVAYMRYEDKCETDAMAQLSFSPGSDSRGRTWDSLSLSKNPLARKDKAPRYPDLFSDITPVEIAWRNYCGWNANMSNADLKWRLFAISRGLGLPVPRPFRAPYIPGITVMIPHYGETIIMSKQELYDPSSVHEQGSSFMRIGGCKVQTRETVPLMDWLKTRYYDEFRFFTTRMQLQGNWDMASGWDEYSDKQWEKICVWASMRMQTLYRTVAGMCLYYPALQVHYDVQREMHSCLSQPGVWKPSDAFTCLVSMQIYKTFSEDWYGQVNKMFDKFPECLKVAFIDWDDLAPKGSSEAQARAARAVGTLDRIHQRQARRYFSCLIDKSCPLAQGSKRRTPKYRIELPGFPILGDGKSDNQNHAIPFMRGIFCQCIDANQGAYFEQMLLLPCVLGEFRTKRRGAGTAKRIIGLPEHITSDFGSIGDFAAGSEIAFGTISQRSFAVLGARMHYGHPDIMNKQYMMQQGGVSKATKTINLSEDIFAGMDFTLRGDGRKIRHCEYFHLAKGRDLGFNSVLGFFSKLSNGTGEQLLTRQMLRLSHVLQLPECLSFYYAHAGYYITQYLVSMSMPITVFAWLMVLVGSCNRELRAFSDVECETPAAEAMAMMLSTWYSAYIFFFLIAASLPLFVEVWMERNFGAAFKRWIMQFFTCSFLLFIFQAKIIGFYIMAEIRQGGASYVATGRGLPTDRREFVGAPSYRFFKLDLWFSGLDVVRLQGMESLRIMVVDRIKEKVAGAAGVETSDVEVELSETGRAGVTVTPPKTSATIPIKGKLAAESLGAAIGEAIVQVPGIRKAASGSEIMVQNRLMDAHTGWRIEKVGGLYLDYTQHTYYNAMDLLILTCCVIYVGGHSEAGPYKDQLIFTFVSIGLVIFSWLYAPFIFNPYQFSARCIINDTKAWYGLFFTDGGKNWTEWYERVIIKPKRGLSKTVFDFDFVFMFFAVTAWISMLAIKQQMNIAIYSKDPIVRYTWYFTLCPPFILSMTYCILLPLLEQLCGCFSRHKRRHRGGGGFLSRLPFGYKRAGRESSSESSGESESDPDEPGSARSGGRRGEEADVRHTMEDHQVTQQPELGLCEKGVPLAFSAAIVSMLQLFELVVPLMLCIHKPDRKLLVCGFILKFMFWKIVLHLAEALMSMKGALQTLNKWVPCIYGSLQLLVYANQMSRDMFVSSFIFVTLSPLTFATILNDMCCPKMSMHQALIYRAAGPMSRQKKGPRRYADDDSGSDSEYGSESDSASSSSPMARPPTSTMFGGRSGVRGFRVP